MLRVNNSLSVINGLLQHRIYFCFFLACTVLTNSSSSSELNCDAELTQVQNSGSRQSAVSSSSSRRSSAGSVIGSRSSSPSPCLGLMMDPARFSLSPDLVTDKPRRRFTKENFTAKTKGTSLELTQEKTDDPLSQLDPLWPLKRL
jgi:hypothetical protein